MPKYRVMRQRIIIEEGEVEAATEAHAKRVAEGSMRSERPNPDWQVTEERTFVLTTARVGQ